MILCDHDCIPCCDFCIHVIHEIAEINDKFITLGPIGCSLHKEKEYQDFAKSCYYCDDYHCYTVPEE